MTPHISNITRAKLCRVMIDPIERAARARGDIVHRQRRIVTPDLDAIVDLLVIAGDCRMVVEAEFSVDCLGWNIVKATALNANQLHNIFRDQLLAEAAQKRADKIKASGRIGNLEVFCLTVRAALKRFQDGHCRVVELNVPPALVRHNTRRIYSPQLLGGRIERARQT
jgi:hypothetical protein